MSPRIVARMVVAVSPSDIGKRVTVRRRVPGGYRDVVGELVSWRDGTLVVRRRTGELVSIDESSLAAARVVPPR